MYVYLRTEPNFLWAVGFWKPDGKWESESYHDSKDKAVARVAYLNGIAAINQVLGEALNSGDGSYRP